MNYYQFLKHINLCFTYNTTKKSTVSSTSDKPIQIASILEDFITHSVVLFEISHCKVF